MGNLNYIVFGGVDSRDYGIYISGEGVFNAPERDVEVVNIPGKDGDLLIDRGRFLNIQVTYPGFNFEPDLSTFAERLRAFRAALASQTGYQRLEDSFHPDEFRLASFRSGLDVNPIMYNTASTFDIVFDCKPQRFLKSGEEEITIGEWGETETITGNIATFEGTDTTAIKSVVAQIVPKQEGSGDPSPDNIRPISGWDEVTVYNTGVNVWDEETELGILNADGSVTTSTIRLTTKNFIPIKEDVEYCMSAPSTAGRGRGAYYDESFNLVEYMNDFPASVTISGNKQYGMFTPSSGAKYLKVCLTVNYGTTYNHDISINYPSTDHEYHSHQGESYDITLPQTVYGGTLDLISGVLTVDRAKIVLDGTQGIWIANWLPRANSVGWLYGGSLAEIKIVENWENMPNLVADKLKTESYYHLYDNDTAGIGVYTNDVYSLVVRSNDTSLTTVDAINSYLSANPITVIYELATPQTYQLTPKQIETLLGVNNIWADSGEVSVEYGADPSVLINPTPFESLPLIEVTGTGTLTVGDVVITIDGEASQVITLDSDMMEAYAEEGGAIVPKNDLITINGNEFPKLDEETGITYTGLTSVKVTPRWWTI